MYEDSWTRRGQQWEGEADTSVPRTQGIALLCLPVLAASVVVSVCHVPFQEKGVLYSHSHPHPRPPHPPSSSPLIPVLLLLPRAHRGRYATHPPTAQIRHSPSPRALHATCHPSMPAVGVGGWMVRCGIGGRRVWNVGWVLCSLVGGQGMRRDCPSFPFPLRCVVLYTYLFQAQTQTRISSLRPYPHPHPSSLRPLFAVRCPSAVLLHRTILSYPLLPSPILSSTALPVHFCSMVLRPHPKYPPTAHSP